MSKSQWQFRPTAVRRLVKAAQSMGLCVSGIEVGTDKISLAIAKPADPQIVEPANDWDSIK
jgi:hypothetical protein